MKVEVYDYAVKLKQGKKTELRQVRVSDEDLGKFAHAKEVQAIAEKLLVEPILILDYRLI